MINVLNYVIKYFFKMLKTILQMTFRIEKKKKTKQQQKKKRKKAT